MPGPGKYSLFHWISRLFLPRMFFFTENLMSKMRAILFEEHGGLHKLKYNYAEKPVPGPHEVLIKVKACALNHLDLWILRGMQTAKIPLPHIMGCDVSGEVAALGSKVKGLALHKPALIAPGISCGKCEYCKDNWDSLCPEYKVLGLQVNGGYAEYVKVPAANVLPLPPGLDFEEAASIPLVSLTAWHMLVTRAQIKKKETVLIHAAGSGLGSVAIQIAKYWETRVITTVGSDEKIKKAKALGADEVINYRKKDFAAEIKRITHGRGVDVVLEHIGPETFPQSLQALAKKGRLVTCGVTSGPTTPLDIRFIFARQLSISGGYLGSLKELKEVVRLFKHKRLKPVVDKVFPLREAPKALERMINRQNFGKIILVP